MALNTGEVEISWQDYLALLIRRQWFVLVPLAVILAVAMGIGYSLPKIYRAQTTLLVQDPKIMNPLMQGMAVATPVERRMQVVQQELLSWTSLSRLANELGLDRQAKTPVAFERLVKGLQKRIVVAANRSGLIVLSFDHPNPELSQRVLNTVTNIYIQRNIEGQVAEAETAIRFIESEMEVYRKKLEDAEQALREFQELHMMEMPVATRLNGQIVGLQVALAQLLVENTEAHPTVIQVKRQIEELKARRNEDIKRVITEALLKGASPEIYGDLAQALNAPVGEAASDNPKVREAQEAYAAWVDRMESTLKAGGPGTAAASTVVVAGGVNGADPSLASSPEIEEAFESGITLSLGPRQQQELARLRRDYKVHAGSYNEMKRRLERARITQRLGESDEGVKFKVIEPARLPLKPISPNLWLFFWGGLGGGLFLGVCAAFTAEYLDQSFLAADDVQTALAVPVIGSISTIVTTGDVLARRERMKTWISLKAQAARLRERLWQPAWSRIDRALLRWGL
jgi:uncharacterized protein involved in exopolysaccharide biosynthesis